MGLPLCCSPGLSVVQGGVRQTTTVKHRRVFIKGRKTFVGNFPVELTCQFGGFFGSCPLSACTGVSLAGSAWTARYHARVPEYTVVAVDRRSVGGPVGGPVDRWRGSDPTPLRKVGESKTTSNSHH